MYQYPKDEILTESIRDGLIDEVHCGFIVYYDGSIVKNILGNPSDYPFYMRSCAKPLQAALLIDYGMDRYYNMTGEEIAICCASHAGEKVHTDILEGLLKKIGLNERYLKCGMHSPLSKTRQREMQIKSMKFSVLHNNCSGKHIMMLGLCKMNNWDIHNYYEPNHPLQLAIKKKIYELSEVRENYPMTTDGCGVPIVSMPLSNMLRGYINLFCDDKYYRIRDAFLNYPYLIGGEDRTDTKIMSLMNDCSRKILAAKVGAGGLCIVVNTEKRAAFAVKVSDCDMKSREIITMSFINRLNWASYDIDNSIKTLYGDVVGFIKSQL